MKVVEKSKIKWCLLALFKVGRAIFTLLYVGDPAQRKGADGAFASFEPCNILAPKSGVDPLSPCRAFHKAHQRSSARTCLVRAPTEMKSIPAAAYPARVSRVTLPETSSLALPPIEANGFLHHGMSKLSSITISARACQRLLQLGQGFDLHFHLPGLRWRASAMAS